MATSLLPPQIFQHYKISSLQRASRFGFSSLSGAHAIGVAHCGAFSRRLFEFTSNNDADPSLNPTFADVLRSQCKNPPNPDDSGNGSTNIVDSEYFVAVEKIEGLFSSDAALLTNPISAEIVKHFKEFLDQFSDSKKKMGSIEELVGGNGQIRKKCRVVKSD